MLFAHLLFPSIIMATCLGIRSCSGSGCDSDVSVLFLSLLLAEILYFGFPAKWNLGMDELLRLLGNVDKNGEFLLVLDPKLMFSDKGICKCGEDIYIL